MEAYIVGLAVLAIAMLGTAFFTLYEGKHQEQ